MEDLLTLLATVAAAVKSAASLAPTEDLGIISLSLVSKTLTFAVAAYSLYRVGVFYDRKNKIDWEHVYDTMETDPASMSRYFGLRLLAFAILAAWIYG
ncbi:MAG: hypothetical protein AB7I36_08180 [Rhodospirillaceae bacterium]